MKQTQKRIKYGILLALCAILFGTACGTENSPAPTKEVSAEPIIKTLRYPDGSYDSEDTAVVTAVDTDNKTVSFWNSEVSKQYTLEFSDTSVITDRYGSKKNFALVKPGDVVTVRFLKETKKIATITYPSDVWVDEEVTNFSFDDNGMSMTIGQEKYNFSKDMLIFGDRGQLSVKDVDACDELTVRGSENTIYSIVVTRGHGYLRLSGDAYFIGGWLEVGNSVLRRITEDVLVAVPAGDHTVRVSNNGNVGEKQVSVLTGEEITVDFSDVEITEKKSGKITFRILPEDAEPKIYVDNAVVENAEATLEYGVHQLLITCDDYEAVVMYLKVGSPSYTFSYTLTAKEKEKTEETTGDTEGDTSGDETQTVTGGETGGNDTEGSASESAYVIISQPNDCELYVDGIYIGITPTIFKKEAGSHVVTFRRTGYQTRSYTITLDDTKEDAQYSFVDLLSID